MTVPDTSSNPSGADPASTVLCRQANALNFPLFDKTITDEIVLVQIDPLERRQTPRTQLDVHNRINEITFNSNSDSSGIRLW